MQTARELEEMLHSGRPTSGILTQKGDGLFHIHPVKVHVYSAGDSVHVEYLCIAVPEKIFDGNTNEVLDTGISEETVSRDIREVRETTGIEPLTAKAAIHQISRLLQRDKGYSLISMPALEGAVFMRPLYEKIDRHKDVKNYSESVAVLLL